VAKDTPPSLGALIRILKPAFKPLSQVRGSHTTPYRIDEELAVEAIRDYASSIGASPQRVEKATRRLAQRFIVKEGNIKEYVVKLKGGKESIIPRHYMSEAFGPVGYNLAPHVEKVIRDCGEACRPIPYLGYGTKEQQFAPDCLGELISALQENETEKRPETPVFLVIEDGRKTYLTVPDFLGKDPYLTKPLPDLQSLFDFQRHIRAFPVDANLKERLVAFFEAPITVGFRDVLRWFEGSRHPDIKFAEAEGIIRMCFQKHGHESFLPPEVNYYTVSGDYDEERLQAVSEANEHAIRAFASWFIAKAPLSWTLRKSDDDIFELSRAILEAHHDYPLFDVEPYSGVFSTATAKLALRVLLYGIAFLGGIDLPERRVPINENLASRVKVVARFLDGLSANDREQFLDLVNSMLFEATMRGGIPTRDGGIAKFTRLDKTFYSFQEKAQYPITRDGDLVEVLTLEDLVEGRFGTLDSHPDVLEKLVVLFVLVYRYFLDTGHVPDLRPDDAGRDLFIKGIWGYKTRNVIISTGFDRNKKPISVVRFVDNKDQFKQYNPILDKDRPLGLAKYGLRLVHPLVEPAMQRSIGLFTSFVAQRQGLASGRFLSLTHKVTRTVNHVLKESVDGAFVHLRAMAHDLIDDATKGIENVLSRKR
jgi:hypothetical protein